LIEPNALLAALKSGRIRAAAFDNIHEKGTQKEAFGTKHLVHFNFLNLKICSVRNQM
jgi:phosphoglycerate dehydrogenase-like enzyme